MSPLHAEYCKGMCTGTRNVDSGLQVQLEKDGGSRTRQLDKLSGLWTSVRDKVYVTPGH